MIRTLLIFIAGIYPIIYIWISISDQLCCKIKLFTFLVHLDVIPNCLIIDTLYLISVLQDNTTNNAYNHIVALINFPKPDFIG